MRTAIGVLALVLLVASSWLYFEANDPGGPMPNIQISEPTNFNEVGILHFPSPESGQAQGVFEFKEGAGTTTLAITMDALSVCAASNGAAPCMAMSITFDKLFDGKAALMEGIRTSGSVLVRKMRVAAEGEALRRFEPGAVFISWPHAIELFKACEVRMATQTHALDVYLDLRDGRTLRAVEPTIDEMFRIIDATQGACGTFPVATE